MVHDQIVNMRLSLPTVGPLGGTLTDATVSFPCIITISTSSNHKPKYIKKNINVKAKFVQFSHQIVLGYHDDIRVSYAYSDLSLRVLGCQQKHKRLSRTFQ